MTGMTNCYRCHEPILAGQELHEGDEHKVCKIKWDKRYDAGMCVKCGESSSQSGSLYCNECETNLLDYKGYEGPK